MAERKLKRQNASLEALWAWRPFGPGQGRTAAKNPGTSQPNFKSDSVYSPTKLSKNDIDKLYFTGEYYDTSDKREKSDNNDNSDKRDKRRRRRRNGRYRKKKRKWKSGRKISSASSR